MSELHTKYRPTTWDQVVGQDAAVRSIQNTLRSGNSRAFILVGEPGVGKTTIARLIARHLGIDPDRGSGYEELDAATRTGVDAMRELKSTLQLRPVGSSDKRVICLDEAHMLSGSAWNSLLKDVEEPPEWVYWVFCTTEPTKVPRSIRTRCVEYTLDLIGDDQLSKILRHVVEAESVQLGDDVEELVIDAAMGSARALLTGLSKVIGVEDLDEAELLLDTVSVGNPDIADLCRELMQRQATFDTTVRILSKMENANAESIRIVICSWFSKMLMKSPSKNTSAHLAILDAFGDPYPSVGKSLHPVLLSLGRLFFTSD